MVAQEAIGLAHQAIQAGRNPAKVVLEIALVRSYAPKPKTPVVTEQAPVETTQEKLTRIAKGQEEGFSLSQAAGARVSTNKGFDARTLVNMSDADFTAFMEEAKKSDLRGLMGD